MADFADDAYALQEQAIAFALSNRMPVGIQAKGACHYCDATLKGAALFCDADCSEDWHLEQKLLQQAGKPSLIAPRQAAATT